jgi:hypothetical protein
VGKSTWYCPLLKGLTFIETLLFYFVFVYYFDFSFLNFLFLQDGLIDWSKPIVWQVPKLGDKYFNWVHVPVDTHMRLFQSDFVEYFSQCAWYIVPMFWIPVMLVLITLSYKALAENPVDWPADSSYGMYKYSQTCI